VFNYKIYFTINASYFSCLEKIPHFPAPQIHLLLYTLNDSQGQQVRQQSMFVWPTPESTMEDFYPKKISLKATKILFTLAIFIS
jgi:hypothetical protein